MDLRSGRPYDNSEKADNSDDGREDNEKHASSPTLLLDDATLGFTTSPKTLRPSSPYQNRG